jgi:hypothetical protein
MNARDRVKLLFGPYKPPALRKGDRTSCLYRDQDVRIIGWTDARIPWPLCRALSARGGGHGLLVDDELARAVRQESAAAIRYWWGVGVHTVWSWRKAFGVGRMDSPGSRRLILPACELGTEQVRGVRLAPEQVEQRRQVALANNLSQYLLQATAERDDRWTEEQLALLGTMPDEEVAAQIGRTACAVGVKRRLLGIGKYRPLGFPGRLWTEEEVSLLGTAPDKEIARRIGRTAWGVYTKRREMGIPSYRPPGGPAYLWTEEELALLGTAADEEIARQTGRTSWAVCRKRRQRGIPKPCDRRRREYRK